jgi:hypothetical protein
MLDCYTGQKRHIYIWQICGQLNDVSDIYRITDYQFSLDGTKTCWISLSIHVSILPTKRCGPSISRPHSIIQTAGINLHHDFYWSTEAWKMWSLPRNKDWWRPEIQILQFIAWTPKPLYHLRETIGRSRTTLYFSIWWNSLNQCDDLDIHAK